MNQSESVFRSPSPTSAAPAAGLPVAWIAASWHADIVGRGYDGFIAEWTRAPQGGAAVPPAIERCVVPGAFEIPLLAQRLARSGRYAAVVACGPEGFIQRLRSVMDEYRWSPSQFVFERFTPAAENNTAAKNAFYIELASSGQRLQVAADQTIAQVLQHAGVEVMLSCEQGMCGSCITGVLDGIPEHRDSVLTAEEKAGNDQITHCCSRAKSPGLVLDL